MNDFIPLDKVKEIIIERGFTKQQAESKVVPIVYDIFYGGNYAVTAREKEDTLKKLDNEIDAKYELISSLYDKIEQKDDDLEKAREDYYSVFNERYKETLDYMKDVKRELEHCETEEARDRFRLAQMFINSVEIDTKYDNTAFIIGLSSLLSGCQISVVDEMKKINPRVFEHAGKMNKPI